MKRYLVFLAVAAAALAQLSCKHAAPSGVAAEVNGQAITYAELDKTFQTQIQTQSQPGEGANEDSIMSQKLELLNSLITSEIMRQRAEKLGLTAVDADVETELNKMRAPYTKDQFDKLMAERHMTMNDLRTQIRRDLTVNKLINKEITSHITVTDAEVTKFYEDNKKAFNRAEPQIHLAEILVTPYPDPNVHNLKNSKAQNESEAQSKIKDLETRLARGEDFGMLAQNYSEDAQFAPNGGDMGMVPESNLEKASPELRKMIVSLPPGVPSQPVKLPDGYRILKVISREPAGQRDLQDPRVQQEIREALLNRKDQLLKSAYYEVARNSAKIQNYLAQSVLDNAGKTK
ncbi:MAG TPA: SurA N-terminal domain-containing protein [Bryobacteraceae bacterium]|nr:SurA N-terminal domain-containing protein [Bryobacteraceae bacterium]